MATTIKIKRSMYLRYKLINILYLVFILFIFLSSPGSYVIHYSTLKQSQKILNDKLLNAFEKQDIPSEEFVSFQKKTKTYIQSMDSLIHEYEKNPKILTNQIEILKRNRISTAAFHEGSPMLLKLENIITQFNHELQILNQSQKFTSEKKILVNERFYKDTPNGVIPSFLESKKTEILTLANDISEQYNLLYLPINVKTTEDKNLLIEKYLLKETYWIGDPIEIEFLYKEQDTLEVWVNDKEIIGETNDLNKIRFSWLAKKSGVEKVRIQVNNETFEYQLKIEKPKLLFQGNIKSLHGSIGDSIIVNLNKNKIEFNKIKIKCSFAEVLIKNKQLLVIPKSSGNFELDIFYKNSKIQSIPVFINDMAEIEVFTANNNFENSRKDIRRLICKDSKKEVFAFNCIILSDGIKKERIENLSSTFNSRLLKAINQTKSGDIIIFEKIRIKDSFLNSELTGKPIVIKQSK